MEEEEEEEEEAGERGAGKEAGAEAVSGEGASGGLRWSKLEDSAVREIAQLSIDEDAGAGRGAIGEAGAAAAAAAALASSSSSTTGAAVEMERRRLQSVIPTLTDPTMDSSVAVDALSVDAVSEVRRAKDRAMARGANRLDEARDDEIDVDAQVRRARAIHGASMKEAGAMLPFNTSFAQLQQQNSRPGTAGSGRPGTAGSGRPGTGRSGGSGGGGGSRPGTGMSGAAVAGGGGGGEGRNSPSSAVE